MARGARSIVRGEIGEDGASTRIERVGGVDGGRVSMRATQELSGVALQERLTELMNGAAGEVEGSVSTAIEATFDPLTLRPDRATYEKNITLQVDGTSQSRFERREMLFEWDDATGCD